MTYRRGNMNGPMTAVTLGIVLLGVTLAGPGAHAQVPESAPPAPADPAPSAVPAPARVLRANHLIPLRFEETLESGVSAPGTLFKMQVTDDITVDDQVVIPAGSVAFGEVIDSKKAGMLGKAGVLVLSARYIRLEHRDIRLHSSLGAAGQSSAAAFFVPFIHGKNATVEKGTLVVVRTVNDETF